MTMEILNLKIKSLHNGEYFKFHANVITLLKETTAYAELIGKLNRIIHLRLIRKEFLSN